jgi:hypothetical protein
MINQTIFSLKHQGVHVIEKIVSGGQTGADRAALDAAIALGVPHGGWLPKGRIAEDGPLPDSYALQEMPSADYRDRTVQNVIDSDGTLIISRGALTGGSATTLTAAKDNKKPSLHIDLNVTPAFSALSEIVDWLIANRIAVLNVAGPRASKDATIYADVRKIIEGVYYLGMVKANMTAQLPPQQSEKGLTHLPGSVAAAVDIIIGAMSLKDRTMVANMTEKEVLSLEETLGRYVAERLDEWTANSALVASYFQLTGKIYQREEAVAVLLQQLWQKLKATHRLRIVK